jgi:hypothetical protein
VRLDKTCRNDVHGNGNSFPATGGDSFSRILGSGAGVFGQQAAHIRRLAGKRKQKKPARADASEESAHAGILLDGSPGTAELSFRQSSNAFKYR